MWPAEALNLACKAQNFVLLVVFFINAPFEWVKTYRFGPWVWSIICFGPHET